ncbi:MAG: hypothetical protein FJ298_02275 [Planctomycetes bacterium]|nr:hypothetical protein [Planctomycetota bacterium]
MIAALVLALWAQDGAAPLARVRWETSAATAGVGEGVAMELVVEHESGARARLAADWADSDYSWLELAPARLDARTNASETRWKIELASLEAGERELPRVQVDIELPSGVKARVEHEARTLRFAPALFDGEDAPREPRDFRPAGPEEVAGLSTWLTVCAVATALLGAACGWLARGRRKSEAPPPSAAARLAELSTRQLDDPSIVRELYYDLSRLVRGELDARAGTRRAAWTDEEWFSGVRDALAPDVASALEELLASCRGAKYAAARPTQWAVREDLARAARVLEGAAPTPRSAA